MNRRDFLKKISLTAATVAIGGCTATSKADEKLNFVFILIDDMGWTDLACFGSKYYKTPNIDKLASDGMRFTNAYAACTVCSPTRASIMTGKYPARLHLTDWISGHEKPYAKLRVPDFTKQLKLEEVTIAESLKEAGYTTAHIGKWHLGSKEYYPQHQGFDINIAGDHRGLPDTFFSPYNIPSITDGPDGEYLTDRLTEESVEFIEANKDKPFYLNLCHYAVHIPLEAKKEIIEKYKKTADPNYPQHNPVYAAMVESVDDSVGGVMKKLEELKISDKTVIIFTSDNGGLIGHRREFWHDTTSNLPLRRGKAHVYEGGIRVPQIIKWPGVAKPGSISNEPVTSTDFYPTMLEIANLPLKPKQHIDGLSLVPLLKGKSKLDREAIFWHWPHYHPEGGTPYGAVRKRNWKLIEFFEDGHLELYNLKKDIGEKNDLAEKEPQKTAELHNLLKNWRKEVDAQMPTPNLDYDPVKNQEFDEQQWGRVDEYWKKFKLPYEY